MSNSLNPSHPLKFNGYRVAQAVLALAGWRVSFDGLPCNQGVIVGYPHTSNWDFIVMVLVKWSIGLPIQFLAKDSLFRIPIFGGWLKSLGGLAVDRSTSSGVVGHLVSLFKQHQLNNAYLWLALSPEGTRRRTDGWRSGFYQLAFQANLPLCLVRIDYGQKHVDFSNFMRLTGDESVDYAHMARVFEGVTGFHANQAAPIQPIKSSSPTSTRT